MIRRHLKMCLTNLLVNPARHYKIKGQGPRTFLNIDTMPKYSKSMILKTEFAIKRMRSEDRGNGNSVTAFLIKILLLTLIRLRW